MKKAKLAVAGILRKHWVGLKVKLGMLEWQQGKRNIGRSGKRNKPESELIGEFSGRQRKPEKDLYHRKKQEEEWAEQERMIKASSRWPTTKGYRQNRYDPLLFYNQAVVDRFRWLLTGQ